MRVGPVIVNNTPLVALWVLGRLDLLRELYDEVLIPLLVELQEAGLYLGASLIDRVLRLAGEK